MLLNPKKNSGKQSLTASSVPKRQAMFNQWFKTDIFALSLATLGFGAVPSLSASASIPKRSGSCKHFRSDLVLFTDRISATRFKVFLEGFYKEIKLEELEGIQASNNDLYQTIEQQKIYKK